MESYEIADIQKYNETQAKQFVEFVTTVSYDEWFEVLAKTHSEKNIYTADIPQFSNFDDGTIQVVSLIRQLGDYGPTYEKIGRDLLGKGRNKIAYLKYGENHSKLAEQCGLLRVKLEGRKKTVFLTEVGKRFDCLDEKYKKEYLDKVVLLIPIIRNIVFSDKEISIISELENYLAHTTAKRRASNINYILKRIKTVYCDVRGTEKYVNLRG